MKLKNNLLQTAIRFGLLGALMNIIALLVLFYLGKHPLLLNPMLDARWPLYGLFIFFAIKMIRNDNNGFLHFWEGLSVGFLVYLIMAQMVAAFIAVLGSIESTQFLADYIRIAMEQISNNREALIANNINEKTLTDALQILPTTTANNLAFDYFLKSMPIGLILTLILSTLMRRTGENEPLKQN